MASGRKVIVLGHAADRELNTQGTPLGEVVLLASRPYEVIGVLQPQGVNFAGEDEDHQALIPLDTYRQQIANRFWLSHLVVHLTAEADAGETVRQVHQLLRQRHNRRSDQVDDVIVRDMTDASAQQSSLLTTALRVVSATSGLLLVLGVVGIATLMLQVVRQRRAEIGLRRALGAGPFDVALQFFLEGMGLATVGVLSGLALGIAGTLAGRQLLGGPVRIEPSLLALSVLVSLGASGIACLAPAIAAARLEPAAALRS